MSGNRQIWNAGASITDQDLQRAADSAARADDCAIAQVCTPQPSMNHDVGGSPETKLVIPLQRFNNSSGAPIILEQIVTASGGGRVVLEHCDLIAFSSAVGVQDAINYAGNILLAARLTDSLLSAQMPANVTGSPTTYLLYATIARSTTTTGLRKVKSLTDGSESTQTLNLADDVVVTLTILGAGSTLASLPADSGTAFNFPLALIDIPTGYSVGTAPAQSWIRPCWRRGGIDPLTVRNVSTMVVPVTVGSNLYSSNYRNNRMDLRHTCTHTRRFLMTLTNVTTVSPYMLLDDSIDYRRRILRLTLLVPTNIGESVDQVTTCGANLTDTSPKLFSGTGGAIYSMNSGKIIAWVAIAVTAGTPTPGALYLQLTATGAGNYVLEVEYSDKLDL